MLVHPFLHRHRLPVEVHAPLAAGNDADVQLLELIKKATTKANGHRDILRHEGKLFNWAILLIGMQLITISYALLRANHDA